MTLRQAVAIFALVLGSLVLFEGPQPVAGDHLDKDIDITKNAQGRHGQQGPREYRLLINLTSHSPALAPDDAVYVIDDVDDDLIIIRLHDVNPDWTCDVINPPDPFNGDSSNTQAIRCDLDENAGLMETQEEILKYDVCDPLKRGSVSNDAWVVVNNVEVDRDQANPNVFACPTLVIQKVCSPEANAGENMTFTFDVNASATGSFLGETSNRAVKCGNT